MAGIAFLKGASSEGKQQAAEKHFYIFTYSLRTNSNWIKSADQRFSFALFFRHPFLTICREQQAFRARTARFEEITVKSWKAK